MHSVYFFISPFYLFYFTFLINEIPNFFPTMDCTIFQQCKQYVGTGKKNFDVHLWRIRSVRFLSKDGTGASYEERNGRNSSLFPARVRILAFMH